MDTAEGRVAGSNDMINPDVRIHYDAPSTLKKWPSIRNQRVSPAGGAGPYLVFEGTLQECIRQFFAKPLREHHLYEISTEPQPALDKTVLSASDVNEIMGRPDFP